MHFFLFPPPFLSPPLPSLPGHRLPALQVLPAPACLLPHLSGPGCRYCHSPAKFTHHFSHCYSYLSFWASPILPLHSPLTALEDSHDSLGAFLLCTTLPHVPNLYGFTVIAPALLRFFASLLASHTPLHLLPARCLSAAHACLGPASAAGACPASQLWHVLSCWVLCIGRTLP